MNGNLVKHFDLSQLGKIMPGGYILGDRRYNGPRMERGRELVQVDWDGNEVWHYNKTEQIEIDKKKSGPPSNTTILIAKAVQPGITRRV